MTVLLFSTPSLCYYSHIRSLIFFHFAFMSFLVYNCCSIVFFCFIYVRTESGHAHMFASSILKVHESLPFSIALAWKGSAPESQGETENQQSSIVFPKGNPIPSIKALTFYRASTFSVDVMYADASDLQVSPKISTYTVIAIYILFTWKIWEFFSLDCFKLLMCCFGNYCHVDRLVLFNLKARGQNWKSKCAWISME